ncbi:MAG: hypothetical protein ACE5GY_06355 [Thermodesulfobacteriota bacterium]
MHQNRRTVFKPILLMLVLAAFAFFTAGAALAKGNGPGLRVTVKISPELRARTNPEQVVFVFAKAVRGPRAPLAAVRAQVKNLPFTVTLDDSRALTPMFKLSRFKDVRVSARISRSGQARKGSGDLEGLSPAITLGRDNTPVTVTIDHVVP